MEGCKTEFKKFIMLDLFSVEEETALSVAEDVDCDKISEEDLFFEEVVTADKAGLVVEVGAFEKTEINETEPIAEEPVFVEAEDVAIGFVEILEVVSTAVDNGATTGKKEGFVNYERFKSMTLEEKAEVFGFTRMGDFDTVHNLVNLFFYDIDYDADGNEIMEEANRCIRGCVIIP